MGLNIPKGCPFHRGRGALEDSFLTLRSRMICERFICDRVKRVNCSFRGPLNAQPWAGGLEERGPLGALRDPFWDPLGSLRGPLGIPWGSVGGLLGALWGSSGPEPGEDPFGSSKIAPFSVN